VGFHEVPWDSMRFHEVPWDFMKFHGILWGFMRFYDVPVNQSVPTEANRGLTSYGMILDAYSKHESLSSYIQIPVCGVARHKGIQYSMPGTEHVASHVLSPRRSWHALATSLPQSMSMLEERS
jgi:hypothetical protein